MNGVISRKVSPSQGQFGGHEWYSVSLGVACVVSVGWLNLLGRFLALSVSSWVDQLNKVSHASICFRSVSEDSIGGC